MSQMLSAPLPWLSILVALPALGAVLLLAIPSLRQAGRAFALILSLCELVVAIVAAVAFDWSHSSTYQLSEAYSWIPQIGLSWALAVNALGLVMVLLAVALVPLVVVAGWNEDEDPSRTGAYLGWVLFLESFMVLIFAASDVLLFYLAFEGMLVPLFVMIGRYGVGEKKARQRAAMKFLLFSLAGGLVMLGGLVAIWALAARRGDTLFMIDTLSSGTVGLPVGIQIGLFLTFFIAFAIKAPMVPLHTWLPDTAENARPGTASVPVGSRKPAVVDLWIRCTVNPLGRFGCHRPKRHHAPGFLHLGFALWLHGSGHFHRLADRADRCHGLHGRPRCLNRRDVPAVRLAVKARRNPRHAPIRRYAAREPRPSWPVALLWLGLDCPSGSLGLRPRVLGSDGHVEGFDPSCTLCSAGSGPGRAVHAHALPASLHRPSARG